MIYVKAANKYAPQPPTRASEHAAGLDLYCGADVIIYPGETKKVPTGYHFEIPPGYVGLIRERSSLAQNGIVTVAGVIDSDYRGQVMMVFTNLSDDPWKLTYQSRVAQMLVVPVLSRDAAVVDELTPTDRGEGGFGSTGT